MSHPGLSLIMTRLFRLRLWIGMRILMFVFVLVLVVIFAVMALSPRMILACLKGENVISTSFHSSSLVIPFPERRGRENRKQGLIHLPNNSLSEGED